MKFIDITGEKYGRLTVIGLAGGRTKQGRLLWKCKCDCGNMVELAAHTIRSGGTKSCGCLKREYDMTVKYRHGGCVGGHSRIYNIWHGMIRRCVDPKDSSYKYYGGRGISVCGEWAHDFNAFKDWAYANGYNEDANRYECTIDRIENDKGYSPDNCRWVTQEVQSNNKRSNRLLTYNGETLTMRQMSEKYEVPYQVLRERLRHGWNIEDAIEKKVGTVWRYPVEVKTR